MTNQVFDFLQNSFHISKSMLDLAEKVEGDLGAQFLQIEATKEINQLKVLHAMQKNGLSENCFFGTTGYGYDDKGREVLDRVYADVFGGMDAFVRHNFVSGTHALAMALGGNLFPGDEILSVTGEPYDTLGEVIGLRGDSKLSLKKMGITYSQVLLKEDGTFNTKELEQKIHDKTKMIFIQRSKGYSTRPSLHIHQIEELIAFVRNIKKNLIVLVDNCYGEFVEDREPTEVGANLVVGSLIKNPGGGLCPTGGYVVGDEEYVQNTGDRLICPGVGKKVGATLGLSRLMFQGLFFAPHVVAESLKGAVFCGAFMEALGYKVYPKPREKRSDIIQGIQFENKQALILFCQGIQSASAVDSFIKPEPWDMPGYDSSVIMAAGAFTQGASIELSADAPIREPYVGFMQGGLVYEHVKLGVLMAAQKMLQEGVLQGLD
jgi:cystathionine beta-lyase family protein involved in aluminum resistance